MGKPNIEEGVMNGYQKAMILSLLAMAVVATPAIGSGNEVKSQRAYFEQAIDKEISSCQNKCTLLSSRSANLRMKGNLAASKAIFLQTNKEELIEKMVASGLKPKPYKVDLFLNHEFSNSSYATSEVNH